MSLNKKDTSIVTLTLLLSIATSPIAWATSRWNSNSSIHDSARSELSLLSPPPVQNIYTIPPVGELERKPISDSGLGFNSQQQILLSQINSRSPQANMNNDSLVGQSSQMQTTTVPATEGEIPVWLWWLIPVIPFLGLWINLQFKAQRSKSSVKKQENLVPVSLSTKPQSTGEPLPENSAQLEWNSLTETLKAPFSPNTNDQFIEPLKTPFSPTITTVSFPRTIIKKRHQTETLQLEENPQSPEYTPTGLIELEANSLDAAIAIPPEELVLFENPVDDELTEPEISVLEIVEPESDIQNESIIVELDSTELEPTVAPVDDELTEPEISVLEIVEPESDIQHESIIVESDSTELEPTVAPVSDELTEPEISVLEIVEPESDIQHESIIVELDSTELESTVAPVDDELTEPEISVLEIVEPESDIQHESIIVESDSTELEPTVAPVSDELMEPEISVSEVLKPKTEVIELGVPHQEIRSETDVAATKFNVGKEIKFEPSLADVDQGLPNLPDGYGHSQIFLLPRDPNWAYAYWDIPNEHKEYIRHQGGKHLLLRVYDVTAIDLDTQPPLSTQEYECDEMAREWHIPIPMSDRDYIAELGYLTLDGRWLVLVRSNHIHIPPIYPTDWENYQFINIPWDEDLRGKTFFRL